MYIEKTKGKSLIPRGWAVLVRENHKADLLHISHDNVIIREALYAATMCGIAFFHRADIVANFENLKDFYLCQRCGPETAFAQILIDLKERINAQGGRP